MQMACSHYTTTGRFNLCSNEREQQVVLCTEFGNVSETWPEGEAPYDYDMRPSEVAEIIRERVKSYWISTSRQEQIKKLDSIQANADRIDAEWMVNRADQLEAEAARLMSRAKALRESVSDMEAA